MSGLALPLYDKVVHVLFYNEELVYEGYKKDNIVINPAVSELRAYYQIMCPEEGGMKPSVHWQSFMLPDSVTIECTLRISGMTLECDIDKIVAFTVWMGYATHPIKRMFFVSVFSATRESPNPDGTVVFTGVVGEWMHLAVRPQRIQLCFLSQEVDMLLALQQIFDEMGCIFQSELVLGAEYNAICTVGRQVYTFESGLELVQWCVSQINMILKDANAKYQIRMQVLSDRFVLYHTGVTLFSVLEWEKVVVLDKVTSIDVVGGVINVIAPFNPMVLPSSLVYVFPSYFRGRKIPLQATINTLSTTGVYRVITQKVDFSSTGTENRMELMCIQIQDFIDQGFKVSEAGAVTIT